jgi:hypothetical protein
MQPEGEPVTTVMCACAAQMQPHEKMPRVCPVARVGVEWKDNAGWWGEGSGRRHTNREGSARD